MAQPSTQLFLDYMEHKNRMQSNYPGHVNWSFVEFCDYAWPVHHECVDVMAMISDRPDGLRLTR